ncbi:hypothetical protein QFC19_000060 [Naganishia cerealis]|uniref:Uncharacterized protein n=1 Tax=Naganishia cerealis TaxID=610337 RepID=A0ACC2WTK5_9TREE|nr:hypothetical protein QFC19_000060 [Naganishia cerealis]
MNKVATDCSLRDINVGSSHASMGEESDPRSRLEPVQSRSPSLSAKKTENEIENLTGNRLGNANGEAQNEVYDYTVWKERVASLEQRLRIVEARLEYSKSTLGSNSHRRSQYQVDQLAPLERTRTSSAKGSRAYSYRHSRRHQLSCSSAQDKAKNDSNSDPDFGLGNILIKHSAPYAGIQEILQRAREEVQGKPLISEKKRDSDPWAREGWVDPVACGLVTEGQMQAAWLWYVGYLSVQLWCNLQLIGVTLFLVTISFSAAFISVLPLSSLVPQPSSPSPPAPRHPFVRLVILTYISETSTLNPFTVSLCQRIRALLLTSLQNLWTVDPSLPVVRALLVLALLPAFTMVPLDNHREDTEEGLDDPYGIDAVDDMNDIDSGENSPLSPGSDTRALPSPVYLLQLARSMGLALGLSRSSVNTVGLTGNGDSREKGMDSSAGSAGLEGFLLQYDYSTHLRMASWIQRLPRPFISELLFPMLSRVGRSLVRSGMKLIVALTSYQDLQLLMPGGNHVLSICAWAGLLHIQAQFKGHAEDEWTGRRHASHLVTFEETVRKIHPGHAGPIIDRYKNFLKHVTPGHNHDSPQRGQSDDRADPSKSTVQSKFVAPAWTFPAHTAGPTGSTGTMGTSLQLHDAVSDIRHQNYLPPLPNLPLHMEVGMPHGFARGSPHDTNFPTAHAQGYVPSLSTFPPPDHAAISDASVSNLQETSGAQMVPFLGEYTLAEMQAFETWWFDMLNADGTPQGVGVMPG